jgi:hypothetical protein
MLRMHRGRYIAFVLNAMFWRVVRNLRAVPLPQLLYCLQQKVSDFLPVKFISRFAIFRIYVSPLFCHILIHSYLPLSHYLTVPLPHWPIAPPLNASLSPLPHCPHRQIFLLSSCLTVCCLTAPLPRRHIPSLSYCLTYHPHSPTAPLLPERTVLLPHYRRCLTFLMHHCPIDHCITASLLHCHTPLHR